MRVLVHIFILDIVSESIGTYFILDILRSPLHPN